MTGMNAYAVPPFAPSNPNAIIDGLATSNGGTIITIPAGATWIGTINLSASAIGFLV